MSIAARTAQSVVGITLSIVGLACFWLGYELQINNTSVGNLDPVSGPSFVILAGLSLVAAYCLIRNVVQRAG